MFQPAQSDKRLCYPLSWIHHNSTCYKQTVKILASLCSCADIFECHLQSISRVLVTPWMDGEYYSVGRCVIPCAFLGKVSSIHFLVEKCVLFKNKYVSIFFLAVLTSWWRHKVVYPFWSYLGLDSWVLWIPSGINMYCLISCGNITDDILCLEHWLWVRILKRLHCQYKKKWRQYQNEKYVIVKAHMTLDHNKLIELPLPLLGYCII